MEPDLDRMLQTCDAALLIGDPALTVDRGRLPGIGFGGGVEALRRQAVCVCLLGGARQAIENHPMRDELAGIFQQSRDRGLRNVEAIAREWAPRVGISEPEVSAYLTRNISYSLDPQKQAGLQLFFELSAELGLIQQARRPEFLSAAPVAGIRAFSR